MATYYNIILLLVVHMLLDYSLLCVMDDLTLQGPNDKSYELKEWDFSIINVSWYGHQSYNYVVCSLSNDTCVYYMCTVFMYMYSVCTYSTMYMYMYVDVYRVHSTSVVCSLCANDILTQSCSCGSCKQGDSLK